MFLLSAEFAKVRPLLLLMLAIPVQVRADQPRLTVFLTDKELNQPAVEYIAKIAKPVTVNFKAGDSLRQIVAQACGRFDSLYFEVLRKSGWTAPLVAGASLQNASPDSKVSGDGSSSVPYCLRLPSVLGPTTPKTSDPANDAEGLASQRTPSIWDSATHLEGLASQRRTTSMTSTAYEKASASQRPWVYSYPVGGGNSSIINPGMAHWANNPAGTTSWLESKRIASNAANTEESPGGTDSLHVGYAGPNVEVLQSVLAAKGQRIKVDGVFGDATEREVKRFQRHSGLAADGIVGPNTWKELCGSSNADIWSKARNLCEAEGKKEAEQPIRYAGYSSIPLKTIEMGMTASGEDPGAKLASLTKTRPGETTHDARLRLISTLASTDFSGDNECLSPAGENSDYPVHIGDLSRVLGPTLAVVRGLLAKTSKPQAILIADSGLHGFGIDPFHKNLFASATTGGDDSRHYAPVPTFPDHMHGTYVTSAAFGTPNLYDTMAMLGFPVQVIMRNIVRHERIENNGKLEHELGADLIANAIQGVNSQTASVVNLSFIGPTAKATIGALIDKGDRLFVVAAGNNGFLDPTTQERKGKKLGGALDYPATFGGQKPNVVTVGAVTTAGTYAEFANWGPEYVELAAPGCTVPVYGYGMETKQFSATNVHGTSAAAPLVSFVAALIHWLMPWEPMQIKNRLLVSANVVDRDEYEDRQQLNKDQAKALKSRPTKVADGRVLNAPKAIAIFHDVLTTRQAGEPFHIGLVAQGLDDVVLCQNSYKLHDLRKIVPRFINSDGEESMLIYHSDDGGKLQRQTCKPQDADLKTSFKFKVARAGVTHTYELGAIRELVFASDHYLRRSP